MHLILTFGFFTAVLAAAHASAQNTSIGVGWVGGKAKENGSLRLSFDVPAGATQLKVCRNASLLQCAAGKAPSLALVRLGPSPRGALHAFAQAESLDLTYTFAATALDAKGSTVASRLFWVLGPVSIVDASTQGEEQ